MIVSAFTFIKNGQLLGYPFLQSINSILPIVDEFVINVGNSEDDTLALVKSIKSSKIRIIESQWIHSKSSLHLHVDFEQVVPIKIYKDNKYIGYFSYNGRFWRN